VRPIAQRLAIHAALGSRFHTWTAFDDEC
jgi:hypothetical protein